MKVHEEHKAHAPKEIKIALIVVSTTRHEELKNKKSSSDKTIPLMEEIMNKREDVSLESTEIIPDAKKEIMNTLNEKIKSKTINSVIFSGGTGLSPKDMTYDLIEPKLEKKIDGFGELFRALSYEEIGASAMLSRATAGKISDKIVFLLPGSPNAVKLALEKLILPEIGHILYIINKKE